MNRPPSLAGDERGAIMVAGVFMSIFLTAMLAYVAAVGQATWYREQLQDAADGTALSAAIIMARGMNFMVLINLVMEALVMIILVLQILVTVLAAVALILTALWLFPAAAFVAGLGYDVHEISQEAQDIIFEILPVLHEVNGIVRVVTPYIAEADSIATSMGDYGRTASFGFIVPSRFTLPMESGTYDRLCEEAGKDLAAFIMELLHMPRVIVKTGSSIIGKVTRALSAWFCGDGGSTGGGPPTVDQDYSHDFPETFLSVKCENSTKTLTEDTSCAEYSTELQDRTPGSDGTCNSAPSPSACRAAAEQARSQCDPHARNVGDYMYSQATISRTYIYNDETGEWSEDKSERKVVDSQVYGARPTVTAFDQSNPDSLEFSEDVDTRAGLGNPCEKYWTTTNDGRGQSLRNEPWNPGIWNEPLPRTTAESEDWLEPVCGEEMEPLPTITQGIPAGRRVTRKQDAVMQIFACSEPRTETVTVMDWNSDSGAAGGGSEEDDKAPYLVEAGKYLGDEDFQVRAVIIGKRHNALSSAFEAASWGTKRSYDEPLLEPLELLATLSLSQAEFYYNGGGGSGIGDDWSWNMFWSARLSHFRLPESKEEDTGSGEAGGAATAQGGTGLPGGGNAAMPSLPNGSLPNLPTSLPSIPTSQPNASGSLSLNGGLGAAGNALGVGGVVNGAGGVTLSGGTDGSFGVNANGTLNGSVSTPQLPGVPAIPGVPQLPGVPGVPQLPGMPGIPSVGVPNVNVPGFNIPGANVAGVNIPGVQVPGTNLNDLANGVGNLPDLNNLPDISNVGVPDLNALPDVAGVSPGQVYDQASQIVSEGLPSITNAGAYLEDAAGEFDLSSAAQKFVYDQLQKTLKDNCVKHGGGSEAACNAIFDSIDSIGALIGH